MNVFGRSDPPFSTQVSVNESPPLGWIRNAWAFLRRRWPAVAIGFAVCIALGAAYLVVAEPKYSADTDLMIDIRRADLLSQQQTQDSQTLNAVLESQVEILRSEGLARKVVARLDLVTDPAFTSNGRNLTGIFGAWISNLLPRDGAPAHVDRQGVTARLLMTMTSVRRIGLT